VTLGLNSQIERLELARQFYGEASEALRAEHDRLRENFRFYCGGDGQWDADALATLDEEGRPHLTINKCMPTLNLLSGYQRKFRQAAEFKPRRGGNAQVAQVITRLCRHAMDTSRPKGDWALSEAFLMGAIGSKWWVGLDIDRSYDLVHGDVLPKSISCFDMLEDPLFRGYDVNQTDVYQHCRYVIQSRWLTGQQLRLLFPDKALELELYQGKLDEMKPSGGDVRLGTRTQSDAAGGDYDSAATVFERGETRTVRWRTRFCWHKRYIRQSYLVMPTMGKIWDMSHKRGEAQQLARSSGGRLEFYERLHPELHLIVTVGEGAGIELEYKKNPLGRLRVYPFERFCPYWVDGMPLGIIDNIKDSQRELNKRRSQLLHHLNSTANSGFDIPNGSISEEEDRRLQSEGASAGFNLHFDPKVGPPVRRTPAPLSEGHLRLGLLADDDIDKVTGLNDAIRGYGDRGKESGEALKTRRDQGLTVGEVVFDNFGATQLGFYETLGELVRYRDDKGRGLYSDEEIALICEEEQLSVDRELLHSMHLGRYGIKVQTSQSTPTVRNQGFVQLMELLQGVPNLAAEVDPLEVLELSDIPGKERIIESVRARRQAMQQQQELAAAQEQQAQLAGGMA